MLQLYVRLACKCSIHPLIIVVTTAHWRSCTSLSEGERIKVLGWICLQGFWPYIKITAFCLMGNFSLPSSLSWPLKNTGLSHSLLCMIYFCPLLHQHQSDRGHQAAATFDCVQGQLASSYQWFQNRQPNCSSFEGETKTGDKEEGWGGGTCDSRKILPSTSGGANPLLNQLTFSCCSCCPKHQAFPKSCFLLLIYFMSLFFKRVISELLWVPWMLCYHFAETLAGTVQLNISHRRTGADSQAETILKAVNHQMWGKQKETDRWRTVQSP